MGIQMSTGRDTCFVNIVWGECQSCDSLAAWRTAVKSELQCLVRPRIGVSAPYRIERPDVLGGLIHEYQAVAT